MAIKLQTLPAVTGIGTATAISPPPGIDELRVTSLTLQAENGNTGSVYVGDEDVTTSTGLILDEGDAMVVTADMIGSSSEEFMVNEVYVISATGTNTVRAACFRRRV